VELTWSLPRWESVCASHAVGTRNTYVQSSLKDGSCAPELLLLEFPGSIAHPVVHVDAVPPYIILEFLPLTALELVELFDIREPLRWRLELLILTVDGFSKQLFGGDLDSRCGLVLDPRGSSCCLHVWGGDAIFKGVMWEVKVCARWRETARRTSVVDVRATAPRQCRGIRAPTSVLDRETGRHVTADACASRLQHDS
jgi:hypothetical protein